MSRTTNLLARAGVLAVAATIVNLPSASAQDAASTWCADRSNLAVLGASSETGYATTGYDSPDNGYWPTRYGWVARLARNAKAEWGTVTDVYARNGAMIKDFFAGGRWPTTAEAIHRVAATQPDLVIIGGALVNEYVNNVDPATAEADLRRLVTGLRDARPGVDILIITYPDIKWPNAGRPWSDYTAVNHRVAVELGTGLVDMQQYIDDPYTDTAGLWDSDNAHLNDAGQAVEGHLWTLLWSWAIRC